MDEPNPLRLAYALRFPAEMARVLAGQGNDAVVAGLEGLPAGSVAALVAHLPRGHAQRVLEDQDDGILREWLDESSLDNALAIARHLDDERRTRVLELLPGASRRETLKRLLIYPRTTTGAVADLAAPRLDAALELDDALEQLRGEQPGTERAIWLVDSEGRYVGLLDTNRALAANTGHHVLSELSVAVRALRAESTLLNTRDHPEWHRHMELPVVDHLDRFIGSLSHERLLEALGDDALSGAGIADVLGELTQQYFHVMGSVLGELFGLRGARR